MIYEQDAGTQGLRTALGNAGVVVALECRASALDSAAILATEVDAIVVNLDAELEELLDEVTEALDAATQPVIYNDPAASSDLSGWDRARWMRHLSAKLKGQSNVTPPPPPGAQAIPMPAKAVEPPPAPAKPSAVAVAAAPVVASAAEAPVVDAGADLGFGDLGLMFDLPLSTDTGTDASGWNEAPPVERPAMESPDSTVELGLADLDLMFDAPPDVPAGGHDAPEAGVAESVVSVSTESLGDATAEFDMADLESIFDEPAVAAPADVAPQSQSFILGEDLGDLDALFDTGTDASESAAAPSAPSALADTVEFEIDSLFSESSDAVAPPVQATVATPAELTDLDALFREFEASQAAANASTPAPGVPASGVAHSSQPPAEARKPVEPKKQVEPRNAPMEWSLEPVELDAPAPQGDRLVAEWRLDTPSKPLAAAEAKVVAPAPSGKPTSSPTIPAELDASLALADLRLLDDSLPMADAPQTPGPADLDALDLSSLDLDSIQPAAAATSAVASGDGLSLADLDFDFLTDQPPTAAGRGDVVLESEHELGDLDSLFEPATEAPLFGLSLADLNRVFVLGASIGGPEAIKAFLARLPASVPAAFVVAQHMGSEFLEMMAMQLDAASPLPVRCPKAGERLRHGEVIVAPANEQLSIDDSGHVRLSAASSGSPYNPSIDHLVRAAADRFGDHATLILFSGMGSDAVEGGRYLTSRGGQVWAQDRASCVIASMIDSAKSQGLVRFEGTPVQLAERVLQVLS